MSAPEGALLTDEGLGAYRDAYIAARESGMDTFRALQEIGQPGLSSSTTPFQALQNKNIDQQQSGG